MNRRQFTKAGVSAAAAAVTGVSGATEKPCFYELRTYELRSDIDSKGLHEFLENHYIPSLRRRKIGPVGCFSVMVGQLSPALITLVPYHTLEELHTNTDLVAGGEDWVSQWKKLETGAAVPYVRYHSALLKAFKGHTKIELPAPSSKTPPHIFELRTYESRNAFDSAAKIDMFNQEEIKIFRDCGLHPVFFGEGISGTRLPHLTYMLSFEDMEARQKNWSVFSANPDWNRIKNLPAWANTVSNITASFLVPTGYSEIK